MRNETIAIHGGFECDPTTKAVAVPIYQTVAYDFDSADHGAALFNLETPGYRYSRIANPTNDVLERRVAALEDGVEALERELRPGRAELRGRSTSRQLGRNIVSVPQLYGTTYTLFSHLLPSQGVTVRFAASDRADAIEQLIDGNTKGVFCESVGNPAGNVCDIEALAEVAHRHGVPLDRRQYRGHADPVEADRLRRRHRRALAHQIHGRPRHDAGRDHRRCRPVPLEAAR